MSRYIDPTPKYTDASNEPLPNGLLYFYESGTNTQKTTYADVNQTIANPHPLVLNGDGSVPNCFYSGAAKVVLADADDVQFWERDPVIGAESSSFGDPWDAISVYGINEVVTFNELLYVSITDNNQNNNPASAAEYWTQFDLLKRWNINETYQSRDPVIATDYNIYISLTTNNQGNEPSASPTEWQATGTGSGSIPAFVDWDSTVSYGEGGANIVTASDENYYVSTAVANLNNNPISSPSEWQQIDHITGGNIVIDDKSISATTLDSDIDLVPNGTGKLTYNGIEVADLNVTNLLAPIDSPTFTTLAVLPANTTIGTVSSTEIGYLNGGTENIQTALDAAARTASAETITGDWDFDNQPKVDGVQGIFTIAAGKFNSGASVLNKNVTSVTDDGADAFTRRVKVTLSENASAASGVLMGVANSSDTSVTGQVCLSSNQTSINTINFNVTDMAANTAPAFANVDLNFVIFDLGR